MKKVISAVLFCLLACISFAQNVGVNTDGTTPESGLMLDVKGTNSYTTTATQNILQLKSADASSAALKLRLGLSTGASLYGTIDVYDANSAVNRPLILQPSSGNVGIGTTTPAVRLTVKSPFANTYSFWSLGTNNVTNIEAGSYSGDNGAININNSAGTSSVFLYSAGSSYFTGGNLGVGTSTPDMKLQVNNGTIAARNTANTQQNTVEVQAFDYVSLPSWKSIFMKFVDGGVAGNIFGSIPNANLGVLGFQNTANALIFTNTNTPIIFGTMSAEAMRISGTGNVGIGTTNPTSKLQITGLPVYANNAAAIAGGLTAGALYTTGAGDPRPVYIVY